MVYPVLCSALMLLVVALADGVLPETRLVRKCKTTCDEQSGVCSLKLYSESVCRIVAGGCSLTVSECAHFTVYGNISEPRLDVCAEQAVSINPDARSPCNACIFTCSPRRFHYECSVPRAPKCTVVCEHVACIAGALDAEHDVHASTISRFRATTIAFIVLFCVAVCISFLIFYYNHRVRESMRKLRILLFSLNRVHSDSTP